MFRIAEGLSNRHQRGCTTSTTLRASFQSQRSSSWPFRFPAHDIGWHGGPPITRSALAYRPASKALMSRWTGTFGHRLRRYSPQSLSISTWHRTSIPFASAARLNPPMPLNRSTAVRIIALIFHAIGNSYGLKLFAPGDGGRSPLRYMSPGFPLFVRPVLPTAGSERGAGGVGRCSRLQLLRGLTIGHGFAVSCWPTPLPCQRTPIS